MRLSNFLQNGFVCLDLRTCIDPPDEEEYDRERYVQKVKEAVIGDVVDLFDATGRVDNRNKLFLDLWNREKKACTAVGNGIAIPHIRSKKVKDVMIGFARSLEGVEFDAPDGEPVHFLIVVVGSSFQPDLYLKVYRQVAEMFRFDGVRNLLHETWSVSDVYRMFDGNY